VTRYTYEIFLRDQGKLDADRDDYLRAVQFQIDSPFDHFNVRETRIAEVIEAAVQAQIARHRRYGETCVHRRIVSPKRPPAPPTRRERHVAPR
jgi:hypothetical protein